MKKPLGLGLIAVVSTFALSACAVDFFGMGTGAGRYDSDIPIDDPDNYDYFDDTYTDVHYPDMMRKLPANIGETLEYDCYYSDDCLSTLTLTEVRVGGECAYGSDPWYAPLEEGLEGEFASPGELEEIGEGRELLQVWAELDFTESDYGWSQLSTPQIIDADGYTNDAYYLDSCRLDNNVYSEFKTPVSAGEKIRVYGAFSIPAGSTELTLDSYRFPIPRD